jgi:hypothetical protein
MTAVTDGGSYGFLLSNQLDSSLPTELGGMTAFAREAGFKVNSFQGAIPTVRKLSTSFPKICSSIIFKYVTLLHSLLRNWGDGQL